MAVVTGDCMNDEAMNQAGYRVGLFLQHQQQPRRWDMVVWLDRLQCFLVVVSYRIVS